MIEDDYPESRPYDPRVEALEAAASRGNGAPTEPARSVPAPIQAQPVQPTEQVIVLERPPEAREVRGTAPKARLDSWIIFAVFALIYGIVGYFVVSDGHIVSFDSLHRLNQAYLSWWNSPPRFSAIGLAQAPLGAIAYMPLTIIKPLATSLIAMPVLTAIAAGMLMALLNSILRRVEMAAIFRYLMVLAFGLNPMVVFYAGNGEPVMLGMVLAAISLLSVISWYITDETRGLVGAGLAMGVAVLVDYQYGIWAIGMMLAIGIIAAGKSDETTRIRSALIVFVTPVAYSILVWTLLNWIILGNPIDWITTNPHMVALNSTDSFRNVTSDPASTFGDLFSVVLGVAPLGFAAIILLLLTAIFSASRLAIGMFLIAIAAVAAPVARVLFSNHADLMTLSIGLPLAVLAFGAVAATMVDEDSWKVPAGVIMLIGLIVAIPLSWNAMKHYDYQNQAQAFTRYVQHRDSQEGTSSVGGITVGIDPERTMASYINDVLPQKDNSILVDEDISYGPMILSGRPQLFADRADDGTGEWNKLRDDPYGSVDYMLVGVGRNADALAKRYPNMLSGGEPGLTPIFRTQRYVLVQVAATAPVTDTGNNNPNVKPTVPTPVEPTRPPSTSSSNDGSATFDATPGNSADNATNNSSSSGSTSSGSTGSGSNGETTAPTTQGE